MCGRAAPFRRVFPIPARLRLAMTLHKKSRLNCEKLPTMAIESQPAVAGDSIKPGVKRSGTPGDCPKIMPARGAGDSGYHDFRAVARSAGCGPWMCCSWGSATLHPRAGSPAEHLGWGARLYAIARYRGLAWISSPNAFLCKASNTLTEHNCFASLLDWTSLKLSGHPRRHFAVTDPPLDT
jgi:hypothetical protein